MFQRLLDLNGATAARVAQILVISLLGTWGCESSSIVYTAGPTLAPADLGLPGSAGESTGFVIVEPSASSGRFPAALAVAKLGSAQDSGTPERAVVRLQEEQAVHWNSLFNTTPAVREVVVLNDKTPGPPLRGLPAIVATARRLNAGLCLVYGATAIGPDEAKMIGALLDTEGGRVVAQIQARATPEDHEAQRPDAPKGDLRHLDLEYLVARKFQRLVHQCVIELITRDKQPGEQRPSPWRIASQPAEDQ